MKITLFRALPDDYRRSMDVYADELLRSMKPLFLSGETAEGFLPKPFFLRPKWARQASQYLLYPLQAGGRQGTVNHIVDHSFAHLVHGLDASRTVVTFHDAIGIRAGHWDQTEETVLKGLSPVQRWNIEGLSKAERIICVSEKSREDLLRYVKVPSEKVNVIHEGVDDFFFEKPSEDPLKVLGLSAGRYLLHVGHTRFYKNIPGLLRIFALLKKKFPEDIKLLRVGEAFSQEQQRAAEKLGVQGSIIHFGTVEKEKLLLAYRAADALILPSLYEGFGFPALEAMACGLPVAASKAGALPEIVGDAGILTEPENEEAFAESLRMILENPSITGQLREKGLRRAREFSWARTAKKTLEVYRGIAKNATGRTFEG